MTKFNEKMKDNELIEYLNQFSSDNLYSWFTEYMDSGYQVYDIDELASDSSLIDFDLLSKFCERSSSNPELGNIMDYGYVAFDLFSMDTSASDKFYDLFAIDEWNDWLSEDTNATAELEDRLD